MTVAHLHLVAVHVPVVLVPLALVLLGLGVWRSRAAGDEPTQATTLSATGRWLIFVSALTGSVAYFSGPPAFESLQVELEAVRDLVELHAVLGRAAFGGLVLLGVLAGQAMLRTVQEQPPLPWLNAILLAGAAVLSYLLVWTGHLGGAIRRPEIAGSLAWLFPAL